MKQKVPLLVLSVLVVLGLVGIFLYRSTFAQPEVAAISKDVSAETAKALKTKIDNIKEKAAAESEHPEASVVEIYEEELESYVLFALREKIPVQVESFDVSLEPERIVSETEITFTSDNKADNPLVEALMGSTHTVFIQGQLTAKEGRGKFDLGEVRIDGIPVPDFLIKALFDRYVTPRYPEADLAKSFDVPYGIEEINFSKGKATIKY